MSWVRRTLSDLRTTVEVVSPGSLLDMLAGNPAGGVVDTAEKDLDSRDIETLRPFVHRTKWIGKIWFRFRAEDVHHVPRTGPVLLVGNHSGGLEPFDWAFTISTIWDEMGPERAVYPLGHDLIRWSNALKRAARRYGSLRAGHKPAHAAFQRGHLVLVYPGSDYDAFRLFSERNNVVLANRTGFIKLALRERVPIVPVVTAGAQETLIVLSRGERAARWLRLKERYRTNVLPIVLCIPWGLSLGYLPYIPLPTQVSMAFCPPLDFTHHPPEAADDPEVVAECYDQVQSVMQSRLEKLTEGRVPWIG